MKDRITQARKELEGLQTDLEKLHARDSSLDRQQLALLRKITAKNKKDKALLTEILRTMYSISVKEAEIEELENIEAQ